MFKMVWCLFAVSLMLFKTDFVKSDLSHVIGQYMGGSNCPTAQGKTCPKDVTFWLYTKSNQKGTQLTQGDGKGFVKGPLKVLIHGFWNNKDSPMNTNLRRGYFGYGDYNIVVVDWGLYTKSGCYSQAVASLEAVGSCVGQFLAALEKAGHGGAHIVGHSLGAHVGEVATGGAKVDRLTKLDPAKPQIPRATKGSAGFTDVYHTNAGLAGQEATSGDVDVFLNNGAFQYGCKCDIACSHMRAVDFFIDSIKSKPLAFRCDGWEAYMGDRCRVPGQHELVVVGDSIDTKIRGTYLVFTNDKAPFGVRDSELTNKVSFEGFRRRVAVSCKPSDVATIIGQMAG